MEIVRVKLNEIIGRHPRYYDLFVPKVIDELNGLRYSLMSGEKLNPVHLMKQDNEDGGYYIIDGASTITVCETLGKSEIDAIIYNWLADPITLMIDLNTNEHRKHKELYMMAEAMWEKMSPGQGKRTDLSGEESGNTYNRIADRLKLKSGNLIKQLLRVGRTQESFFSDIDSGLTPLDKAYRDCVNIEKKRKEENEAGALVNFVGTTTNAPEFSELDTTSETDPAIQYEYNGGFSKNFKTILNNLQKLSGDDMRKLNHYFSSETGTCVCCGRENNSSAREGVQS